MFKHIQKAVAALLPHDEPALEKMTVPLFVRNYESFRPALIPGRLVAMEKLQLPNFSTLHTINHFLTYSDKDTIDPDPNNPLIVNEQWPIYLQHWLQVPTRTSRPFPVVEKYTYVPNKYRPQVMAFFHHQHRIRRLLSEIAVARQANVLVVNEYSALNHLRLTGQLATYRHFDIILRTILDHICNSKDKRLHFMQFPLSARPYTRTQFIRTFDKLNISTLRILNDPSYFLMIHLLGFVWGETVEEPQAQMAQADRVILDAQQEPPLLTSTSLFARVPDDVLARLHIVLTHGGKAIIYNLGDLKKMAVSGTMFLKVLRHINALKLSEVADELPDETAPDEVFDNAVAQRQAETVEPPAETPVEPPHKALAMEPESLPPEADVKPVSAPPPGRTVASSIEPSAAPIIPPNKTAASPVVGTSVGHPPVKTPPPPVKFNFHQHVISHLHERLAANPETHEISKSKVDELYTRHLAVELNGKTLAQHLATVLPDINTNTLDFLNGKLPDQNMAHSSVANLDTLYIQHGMHHDLAKTLTSLVQHGLFVTHIDTVSDHTEFTKRTIYKVALTDVQGKRHSLVFALPHVSNTGRMVVNGVETRMTKQQINLPICKISESRVNLSSNYNKTLVERTATRRHNFSSYFNTYLTALRLNGLVTVSYGKLPSGSTPLPYDYSAIGQTYTRIDGEQGMLIFDYAKRFNGISQTVGATEAYREPNSTFTRNGRTYSISSLLEETEHLPIQLFKVKDLQEILKDNPPDPDRSIDNAYLGAPILVIKVGQKYIVIDGLHRLAKAVKLGIKTLPGRLVPLEMLEQHYVPTPSIQPSVSVDILREHEKEYGVFCGTDASGSLLFMGTDNKITIVHPQPDNQPVGYAKTRFSVVELLLHWYPSVTPAPMISEWTELKVLDETFPIIFVLGFRYGLSAVLKENRFTYRWIDAADKADASYVPVKEITIPFADGTMIVPRYPLHESLILAGLLKYPTKTYNRAEFDSPDVYYRLLMQANISINFLKGITGFFDFFLDPITLDVLQHMGEPTTVKGLLLRASDMLSTYDHHEAASMRHHRLRGYERFSGVLYNEVTRQLAAYQGKRTAKKSFSINPEAVFQKIMTDSTVSAVETINPIHEIKGNTGLTYAGSGGRTSKSFVVEDRRYPEDAIGIMSEATPDSGKVAMNAYTTADPKLANLRGMFAQEKDELTPANVLSTTAMLMPCSVQDDGKRTNYLSVQLSHHVPSLTSEVNRVRTGYEMTIAHRTSEDFSCVARQAGKVVSVDNDLKLLKVEYTPQVIKTAGARSLPYPELTLKQALATGTPLPVLMTPSERENFSPYKTFSASRDVNITLIEEIEFRTLAAVPDKTTLNHMTPALVAQHKQHPDMPVVYARFAVSGKFAKPEIDLFQFGARYTNVSGSYLQQDIVVNVQPGEVFKRGDVLAYNEGFFAPDPDSKQVNWKHGVMANVALIEMGATLEDSCMITKTFGERLRMAPAHVRQIELTASTVIHSIVSIGDHVETTDQLAIIEEGDLEALGGVDDAATLTFHSNLNRKILRAKYHGTIAEIQLYYSCAPDVLHPSLAKLARTLRRQKEQLAKAAQETLKEEHYLVSQFVAPGTKYRGTLFGDDTVVLLITITESITAGVGDKCVLGLQAKSVIGEVLEHPPSSESGVEIDVIFSTSSIAKRILSSPHLIGVANRILEHMESAVTELYFED